jgi:hypothetical protein
MADLQDVKQYLAHWFQLGKKVLLHNGQEALIPERIFAGDHYSPEFEDCWQKVLDPASGICYLEGTEQTLEDLLSPRWDFHPCARCELPVPIQPSGHSSLACPCHDLDNWPNLTLPSPHLPADNQQHLDRIRQSLQTPSDRTG